MTQKELTVLMVEPGKHPKVTKIKDDLDSLQKAVSIGADYQGLIAFAIFATKSSRWMVDGRGEQYRLNRRYGLYDRIREKPSSPASRTKKYGYPFGYPYFLHARWDLKRAALPKAR